MGLRTIILLVVIILSHDLSAAYNPRRRQSTNPTRGTQGSQKQQRPTKAPRTLRTKAGVITPGRTIVKEESPSTVFHAIPAQGTVVTAIPLEGAAQLFHLVASDQQFGRKHFRDFLEKYQELKSHIAELEDQGGSNIFHHSIIVGKVGIILETLIILREQNEQDITIKQAINHYNNQKNSPLIMALRTRAKRIAPLIALVIRSVDGTIDHDHLAAIEASHHELLDGKTTLYDFVYTLNSISVEKAKEHIDTILGEFNQSDRIIDFQIAIDKVVNEITKLTQKMIAD